MVNGPFVNAAARIEEAIASILEFAATTGNQGFIERIMRLAIKKEIVLELLLDEIGDTVTECSCNATVNATIPNTFISVNGVGDIGDVTFTGQICPNCFVEGSTLTFRFVDDTPTPTNNSFTFVSTSIQAPTCIFDPFDGISLFTSGFGVVTRADMTTVNVGFNVSFFESTVPPGGTDFFNINFFSIDPGNPFLANYSSPSLPDPSIVVGDC
jgi:hypothetical protein